MKNGKWLVKMTMREKDNKHCVREVFVGTKLRSPAALARAATATLKLNPHGLWVPKIVSIEVLAPLYE